MKQLLTSLLAVFLLLSLGDSLQAMNSSPVAAAMQNGGRSGGDHDGDGDGGSHHHGGGHDGDHDLPFNSPEPITMFALLGGAAAAGAISKRRKGKDSDDA